jgi:hypothetical protein
VNSVIFFPFFGGEPFKIFCVFTRQNGMFFFLFWIKPNILNRFWPADHESDNRFSLARQVPDIILNKSSKNIENALIECLGKEMASYFTKSKYTWFVWLFESSFQNCFWNFFYHLWVWSLISKIRNVWKLPVPIKSYSDPMLWKNFWEFKNIIFEENLIIKLKNSHDNFSGERVSMVLGLLFLLGFTAKFFFEFFG